MGNKMKEENIPETEFGTVIVETLELIGIEIKNEDWGKFYISTNPQGKPQYTTDTSPNAGAGYMKNHLEVDGKTKIIVHYQVLQYLLVHYEFLILILIQTDKYFLRVVMMLLK